MTDQTSFSTQEPWLEPTWTPPTEPVKPVEPEEDKSKKAWYKKRKWQIAFVASSMILASLIGVAMISTMSTPTTVMPEVSPQPSIVPGSASTLEKRLQEIETAWRQVDPAVDFLPYPPVSFELWLDQPDRR